MNYQMQQSGGEDLNRNAMIVYLNNMRIIETVLYQSRKARERMDSELSSLDAAEKNAQDRLKYARSNVTDGKMTGDDKANTAWTVTMCIFAGAIVFLISLGLNWVLEEFLGFGGKHLILKFFQLVGLIIAIGGPIFYIKNGKTEAKDRQQHSISNVSDQEQALQEAQSRAQEAHRQYDAPLAKISEQIRTYENMRDNGYALNLIPYSSNDATNCRTLQGVLFLYEFMSTSRENFTTALAHYKYELIVNRLDTLIGQVNSVISNQEAILRNQEQTLREIRNSGQRIGESLEAIRDYDSIIAQNSELQTAMNRESLYYQRVTYIRNL